MQIFKEVETIFGAQDLQNCVLRLEYLNEVWDSSFYYVVTKCYFWSYAYDIKIDCNKKKKPKSGYSIKRFCIKT